MVTTSSVASDPWRVAFSNCEAPGTQSGNRPRPPTSKLSLWSATTTTTLTRKATTTTTRKTTTTTITTTIVFMFCQRCLDDELVTST